MKTNPKAALIRKTCQALVATFRRAHADAGRALANPTATLAIRDNLEASLAQLIKAELGKSGLPVVSPAEAVPAGAHWLVQPLDGRRNFLHGRLPVSVNIAYVLEDGRCPLGAVYFPVEDVLAIAEMGTGASGPERLRTGGRTTLSDALLLLPLKTADMKPLFPLLEQADEQALHTRKTGHTLFDVIDVAAGRADALVATRLNRLEVLLAGLILSEAGAKASDMAGQPLTASSTTLLAANLKLHPVLVEAVRS